MQPTAPSFLQNSNFAVARDDRDRAAAQRCAAIWIAIEPRPPAPPQTSTTSSSAHGVRRPADAACGRRSRRRACGAAASSHVRCGGLRHALVRLHLRELREAAPVGLVAPDAGTRGEHRIVARHHLRVVGVPQAAVDDDLVADLDVRDVLADGVDDAGGVAAADVEVRRARPPSARAPASTSIGMPSAAQTLL